MIPFDQKQFIAEDGTKIFYYSTPVTADTQCLMLIIHGMTEHASRYRGFAEKLFRKNISVVTLDLRGHGATGQTMGTMGHFADEKGWDKMIGDVHQLTEMIKAAHPELPLLLFGHSMGSVAARTCLIRFGELYHAGIISGTTIGVNAALLSAGVAIANFEIKRYGATHPSKILAGITFGNYNKKFKPNQSHFDWLSDNTDLVKTYVKDPLCGFLCSSAFYRDMFGGIKETGTKENMAKMPKDLPILLISGGDDPVGGMGKEIQTLYTRMQQAGLVNVSYTLIPGKRHELVNDESSDEAMNRILEFIEKWIGNRN